MPLDASPLAAGHIPEASMLYGRAFRDDPFACAALAGLEGDTRERCLRGFFAASACFCARRGYPWEFRDGGRMVAVLLAYPPGGYPPPLTAQVRIFLKSAWHIRFLGREMPSTAGRLLTMWKELAKEHPKPAHYYCEYLAVLPEHQGQGVATAFAHILLPLADAGRVGCYLETPNPRTIPLYARLGFHPLGDKEILGVRWWFMWRDPQPSRP